jgi:hypothetical protein
MAVPDAPREVPRAAEAPRVRPLDAEQSSPSAPRPRGRVGVVLALVVAALVAGFLLGTGSVRESPEPLTRLGVAAEANGLAVAVDGLEDTLLVVATNGGRAMDIVMWPPHGALSMRAAPIAWTAVTIDGFPFGGFAAFDSSGRYLALAAPVSAESSAVLMAGRLEEQVVVATGVTGYAWNTSDPHQLAVEVEEDGLTRIRVMLGAPMSLVPATDLPANASLEAWGPWGFLTSVDDHLVLESIELRVRGEFLGAGPEVIVVATDTGVEVIEVGSRGDGGRMALDFRGSVAAVEAATGRVAIGGPDGLVAVTAEGARIAEIEHPFVERLDWSSDGRFIVFADRVDVLVLDLETGEITATGLGPSEAVMLRASAAG